MTEEQKTELEILCPVCDDVREMLILDQVDEILHQCPTCKAVWQPAFSPLKPKNKKA